MSTTIAIDPTQCQELGIDPVDTAIDLPAAGADPSSWANDQHWWLSPVAAYSAPNTAVGGTRA